MSVRALETARFACVSWGFGCSVGRSARPPSFVASLVADATQDERSNVTKKPLKILSGFFDEREKLLRYLGRKVSTMLLEDIL